MCDTCGETFPEDGPKAIVTIQLDQLPDGDWHTTIEVEGQSVPAGAVAQALLGLGAQIHLETEQAAARDQAVTALATDMTAEIEQALRDVAPTEDGD